MTCLRSGSLASCVLFVLAFTLHVPVSRSIESATAKTPEDTGTTGLTMKEATLCQPWPDCVTEWVETAFKERTRAGEPLKDMLDAIKEGREQNCTRTRECAARDRIKEIDAILAGAQKKWEDKAGSALAARSKVEDNLWKRWMKQAQERAADLQRLARARAEAESMLADVWLRRMSALSLQASLVPVSAPAITNLSAGGSTASVPGAGAGGALEGWEHGGSARDSALSESWTIRSNLPPNISRADTLAALQRAGRCMLRDLLDMALDESDVTHAVCPLNGKHDCFLRCRRYCKVEPECRVYGVTGISCLVSTSPTTHADMARIMVRLPQSQVGFVPPPSLAARLDGMAESRSGDKKLVEAFKKLQRQAPHSKGHKLGVIVPFRDGCSAMSQGKGRRENLMEFVTHMPLFLDMVGVSSFRVIVVEQTQNGHWNKGVLFNRGVAYAESIGCDYVVMNDVDQIPVSDKIIHEWPKEPLHLCTNTDQHGFQFYDAMVGGAFLLQIAHYKKLNGYSNRYFGWGQEDDDMYERVRFVFKEVKHIDQKFGSYHALQHGRVKDLDATDMFRNNSRYLDTLRNKGPAIFNNDGYKQVEKLTNLVHVWKGPSAEIREDMAVIGSGDYDHLLVDALDPQKLKSFPKCADTFDKHSKVAGH